MLRPAGQGAPGTGRGTPTTSLGDPSAARPGPHTLISPPPNPALAHPVRTVTVTPSGSHRPGTVTWPTRMTVQTRQVTVAGRDRVEVLSCGQRPNRRMDGKAGPGPGIRVKLEAEPRGDPCRAHAG